MSFFASNPFSSPVGQRIERATSESLASEDWALIIEICDIINESEDAHKEAMKAIKKKLAGNKKWKEVIYTLTLLETCVKNCGHRFHALVCKHEFIKELVKIIQPSFNPPTVVQEKILALIQSWADAFRALPDLQGVVKVYEELKAKGIEFPATDLDTLSPIITPERSIPEIDPAVAHPGPPQQRQPVVQPVYWQPQSQAVPQPPGPINLTPNQLAMMQKDLQVVQGNFKVFSEMLTEMTPGQEDPGDLELLHELNRTCRSMQARVVNLLDKVSNEEVTGELLRINDDLNNVFVRYDRFERYRLSQTNQTSVPQANPTHPSATPYPSGTPQGVAPYPTGAPGVAPYTTGAPGMAPYPMGTSAVPAYQVGVAGTPAYQVGAPATGVPPYQVGPPTTGVPSYQVGAPATGVPPYSTGPPVSYGTNQGLPPTTAPSSQVPSYPSVGSLINFDDTPVQDTTPPAAAGQLTQHLAAMSLGDSSVSSTLGQLDSTPSAASNDDFDMFALSRQTAYQDTTRAGSTYQDNDQTCGGLANAMNSRAVNPFAAEAQAMNKGDDEELPADFSQLENMEQWLNTSDLAKPVDSAAAANTNPEGITSTEFDKFLEERAAAGDSLPGQGSTVNLGGRQLKMEEMENTMFSL